MDDSREIVLAGNAYKITVPLTLGQLIDCNVALASKKSDDPEEEAQLSYQRTLKVVAAALKAEHPEMTIEALKNLRGITMREFNTAATAIFEESGLVPRKVVGDDPKPGEATAEAD